MRTTFTYDYRNRLKKHIFPDSKYYEYAYDANGNRTLEKKRDGTWIHYTYDSMNRLTDVYYSGTESNPANLTAEDRVQHFTYDKPSRMTLAEEYEQGTFTLLHSVTMTYDSLSRLKSEEQDSSDWKPVFHYNNRSLLSGIDYPNGKSLTRSSDDRGFLDTITYNGSPVAKYTWDGASRLETVELGNNLTLNISRLDNGDEIYRDYQNQSGSTLVSQAGGTISGQVLTHAYDYRGNLTREEISIDGHTDPWVYDYTYDKLDRIDDVSCTQGSANETRDWTYDRIGNWDMLSINNGTPIDIDFNNNADNEYDSYASNAVTYDDNGNLTEYTRRDGVLMTFVYDWADRLIEVQESGSIVADYTYDALNRRVTKTAFGTTTRYIYHGGQVIEEYEKNEGAHDDTYALARSFIYGAGIDDAVMMTDSNGSYYYLKGRNNSTLALADTSGAIVESYSYTPFGEATIYDSGASTITSSAYDNPYTYTGRRFDLESGLYYYRNRMYSAALGRFLTRDPASYVDGMNLYAYVTNNPIMFMDPMGTEYIQMRDGSYYWIDEGSDIRNDVGSSMDWEATYGSNDEPRTPIDLYPSDYDPEYDNQPGVNSTLCKLTLLRPFTIIGGYVLDDEYSLVDTDKFMQSELRNRADLFYKHFVKENVNSLNNNDWTPLLIPQNTNEVSYVREITQDFEGDSYWSVESGFLSSASKITVSGLLEAKIDGNKILFRNVDTIWNWFDNIDANSFPIISHLLGEKSVYSNGTIIERIVQFGRQTLEGFWDIFCDGILNTEYDVIITWQEKNHNNVTGTTGKAPFPRKANGNKK